MFTRTLKVAAVGGALLLGLAVSAYSNGWSNPLHRDYVTFSGAVSLPGVTLRTTRRGRAALRRLQRRGRQVRIIVTGRDRYDVAERLTLRTRASELRG